MAIYLLHATRPLGTSGRGSAQHYLGWTTEGQIFYRIAEHQHGTANCAITRAFKVRGAELIPVYVRWSGTLAEEGYLKRNGHYKVFCPICNPLIARYPRVDEWFLPPDLRTTFAEHLPKLRSLIGGDSSAGSPTGKRGYYRHGPSRASGTVSRSRKTGRYVSGTTPSPATAPQPRKEDT